MKEYKKTNPLSAYHVTDKEFEYFGEFYKIERRAYWKGIVIGSLVATALCILIAIVK